MLHLGQILKNVPPLFSESTSIVRYLDTARGRVRRQSRNDYPAPARDAVPRRCRGSLARMGARPSEGARDRLRSDALRGIYGGGAPGASRPLGREKPPSRPFTGCKKRAQAAPLEDSLPACARRLRGRTAPSRIPASVFRAGARAWDPPHGARGPPARGTARPHRARARHRSRRRSPCARARAQGAPCRTLPMPSRAAPAVAPAKASGIWARGQEDRAPRRSRRRSRMRARAPRTRCGEPQPRRGAATPEKAPRSRPQTGAERCTLAPRCRRAAPAVAPGGTEVIGLVPHPKLTLFPADATQWRETA